MATQGMQRLAPHYHRGNVPYSMLQQTQFNAFSETSEILDTDFDTDTQSESGEDSSQRSTCSLGTESVTTASTPDDDIKTPGSTGLGGFPFRFDTAGPTGPHLFSLSDGNADIKSGVSVKLVYSDEPISASTPLYAAASKLGPYRRDTPVPSRPERPRSQTHSRRANFNDVESQPNGADVESWKPQEVSVWMQKLDFDQDLIDIFRRNDISGSVLLDLNHDLLKYDLGIESLGKRHGLMNAIRRLRDINSASYKEIPPAPPLEPVSREATPQSAMADVGTACTSTPVASDADSIQQLREYQLRHRHDRHRPYRVIGPDDSVSLVSVERVHKCKKGKDCPKWGKVYTKTIYGSKGLASESARSPIVVDGEPGKAATARNLPKIPKPESKTDVTPSIVASSDVFGPAQPTDLPLSQEKLHDVQPRDPQENVRNFLNFQRLSRLRPVEDPATPPRETFPSPESFSPGHLAENLRSLPKLRIPSSHGTLETSALSPPTLSGQRTITPSVVRRKQVYAPDSSAVTDDRIFSPADYYRQDPHYGQSTPFSEVDVPLTAIQVGPIERNISQSVPPNMRFGAYGYPTADPICRPRSTKFGNNRRKPSSSSYNTPILTRLDEGRIMTPIETPEDLERTPRAAHCRVDPFSPSGEFANEIIHSGWMKKRKTTRFLRHEWQDHHFALRGTQLAMYDDEQSSRHASKALEYVDVDDYAVACSSLASSSKLTAAFKKTVLKRKDDTRGDTAFAFSLIPSPNGSTFDRKAVFNGNKSHHFSVKTRDQRIDWMRELMLAKALRRGRESGASLNMNGNAI